MKNKTLKGATWLLTIFLAGPASIRGGQLPKPNEQAQASEVQQRATEYYQAILAGNSNQALQFVAQESKDDFPHTVYTGVIKFRVADVTLSDKGDVATVNVWWTQIVSSLPRPLDREVQNTWKLIDGQWYLVLPSSTILETPFGKIVTGQGQASQSQPQNLQEMVEKSEKNADPDQYMIALQKAARQAKEAKAEGAKSEPSPPQDEKAKPQN